jgi:hypothetical protein
MLRCLIVASHLFTDELEQRDCTTCYVTHS